MTASRILTIDVVRGVAVLGILLMNIVALGLPGFAYVNPLVYGLEGRADVAFWAFNAVFVDGKMRALFTLLFGASMLLLIERAVALDESPARLHYRRMLWLFGFGMLHAWFIWYGDILVQYAVAGAMIYPLWRVSDRWLCIVFGLMLTAQIAASLGNFAWLSSLRDAAQAPDASMVTIAAWRDAVAEQLPNAKQIASELAAYRGGFTAVFAERVPTTIFFQAVLMPMTLPETIAFMALGMLVFRNGFLKGGWPYRGYLVVLVIGYGLAIPGVAAMAWINWHAAFDIATVAGTEAVSLALRPFVALAHASLIILIVQSGRAKALMGRLAAVGQTALSNYLGTSLVATTIFYGYGLGWFGYLSRAELLIVVALIWAIMLAWSKPWLARYRYGPLEWLWRMLARGTPQPMVRSVQSPD